eukprot:2065522-Rhodomonas_salina.1
MNCTAGSTECGAGSVRIGGARTHLDARAEVEVHIHRERARKCTHDPHNFFLRLPHTLYQEKKEKKAKFQPERQTCRGLSEIVAAVHWNGGVLGLLRELKGKLGKSRMKKGGRACTILR